MSGMFENAVHKVGNASTTLCIGGPLDGASVHVDTNSFTARREDGDEHRYTLMHVAVTGDQAGPSKAYIHSSLDLDAAVKAFMAREVRP